MATSQVAAYFPCPVERVRQTATDFAHTAWRSDLCEPILIRSGAL